MLGAKKRKMRAELDACRASARGRLNRDLWEIDEAHESYFAEADAVGLDLVSVVTGGGPLVDPLGPEERGAVDSLMKHLFRYEGSYAPTFAADDSYILSEAESWEDFDCERFADLLRGACEAHETQMGGVKFWVGGSFFGTLSHHPHSGFRPFPTFKDSWSYFESQGAVRRLKALGHRSFDTMKHVMRPGADPFQLETEHEVATLAGALIERIVTLRRDGLLR